jgi:hypothetical protein
MSLFECLSPEELVALANAVALTIGKDKNEDELSSLGNFWSLVGQILQAESAQKELLKSKKEKLEEIKE